MVRACLLAGAGEPPRKSGHHVDFPCDASLDHIDDRLFRGITINAAPEVVFRWLCQLRAATLQLRLDRQRWPSKSSTADAGIRATGNWSGCHDHFHAHRLHRRQAAHNPTQTLSQRKLGFRRHCRQLLDCSPSRGRLPLIGKAGGSVSAHS